MPDRDLALARETLGAAKYLLKGGYYKDTIYIRIENPAVWYEEVTANGSEDAQ